MEYFEGKTFECLSEFDFVPTEFVECQFKGLDLSNKSFKGSKFIDCSFRNSNGSNLKVLNTSFRGVSFIDCKLIGINWSESNSIKDLIFDQSQLNYCVFQELDLSGC